MSSYSQSRSVYFMCTYLKDLSQRSICMALHTTSQSTGIGFPGKPLLCPCLHIPCLPTRFEIYIWSPVLFSKLLLNVSTWMRHRHFKFKLFKLASWSGRSFNPASAFPASDWWWLFSPFSHMGVLASSEHLRVLRWARGQSAVGKTYSVVRGCLLANSGTTIRCMPMDKSFKPKILLLIVCTRRMIVLQPTLHRCFEGLTN